MACGVRVEAARQEPVFSDEYPLPTPLRAGAALTPATQVSDQQSER